MPQYRPYKPRTRTRSGPVVGLITALVAVPLAVLGVAVSAAHDGARSAHHARKASAGTHPPGSSPAARPAPPDDAASASAGNSGDDSGGGSDTGTSPTPGGSGGSGGGPGGSSEGSADGPGHGRKVVYLSFDDGPSPQYTNQILDVLDRHHVKATFFELGQHIAEHPEITRRAHEAGHSIQNHTWSHPDLRKVSAARFTSQVQSTDEQIRAQTGYTPRCLRPPYGATNSKVKSRTAALGKKVRLWTADTEDWTDTNPQEITHKALAGVHAESIILMHDGGGDRSDTVTALPRIIEKLRARGFGFAPLWCP